MDLASLPVRATPDREYLGAICELLLEQLGVLERLAERVAAVEVVVASLPTRTCCDRQAPSAADPEPDAAQDPERSDIAATESELVDTADQEPVGEVVVIREPATPPPPTSGSGSSRAAWERYATSRDITVDQTWSKQRIITECRSAGIL